MSYDDGVLAPATDESIPQANHKSRRCFLPVNEASQLAKRGYRQYARKHENPSWPFRSAYAYMMLLRRDHRHQIHRSVNVESESESERERGRVVLETTMHAQLDSPDAAIPLPSCASGERLFVESIRAGGAV